MSIPPPRSSLGLAPSILALLAPVPVVCFVGALLTDVTYWRTANVQWANMSSWMLAIGLLVAVLVVIAALAAFLTDRRLRTRTSLIPAAGYAVALALSILNAFIHSRDAYTSVVPGGLFLSLAVVIVLAATGLGWFARPTMGVYSEDRA